MNLQELTSRMNAFVESKGWYNKDSTRPQTPRNIATSLVLEAGEVLEHFQWTDCVTNKEAFAGELADVMLYLLQLSSICDVDLEKAVLNKLDTNYKRTWDNNQGPCQK